MESVLKFSMVLVFTLWCVNYLTRSLTAWQRFWQPVVAKTTSKSFPNGPHIVVYAAPVIFIAIAGSRGILSRNSRLKSFKHNPVTYPLFIKGPLSIVPASDFIFLSALVIFTVYSFTSYYLKSVSTIDKAKFKTLHFLRWHEKLEMAGVSLGLIGMFCMAILFFPVTRGSAILRIINIPFEHAVKFHIWIAVTMLVCWTAHGAVYIIYWLVEKKIHELWSWHTDDISGLSGLLALIIGLIMWLTSLGWVRKRNFELFYYTHHLYVLFILFYGLHLGDKLYMTTLGGALIFFASRLTRCMQSQQTVDIIAANLLSTETMELVFAKEPGWCPLEYSFLFNGFNITCLAFRADLHYSAASCVFLNFPAISHLQWHPFTVVSSSNVETDHLSLLIKRNGDWTSRLFTMIENAKTGQPLKLEARIEGPYGHNLDYLSRYDVLMFIAGGSGISPFISLLKEVLHSVQAKQIPPPKDITLIYTVKKSDELHILYSVPHTICPEFSANIDIRVYVTREQGPDPEENSVPKNIPVLQNVGEIELAMYPSTRDSKVVHAEASPNTVTRRVRAMSPPLTTSGIVEAAIILASFLGFLFIAGIIGRYYIYSFTSADKNFARSVKGFLAFLETVIGVLVAGGATAFTFSFFSKKNRWIPQAAALTEMASTTSSPLSSVLSGIFSEHAKRTAGLNVGVFACGPLSMQEDVAFLCQEYRTTNEKAVYNYHGNPKMAAVE